MYTSGVRTEKSQTWVLSLLPPSPRTYVRLIDSPALKSRATAPRQGHCVSVHVIFTTCVCETEYMWSGFGTWEIHFGGARLAAAVALVTFASFLFTSSSPKSPSRLPWSRLEDWYYTIAVIKIIPRHPLSRRGQWSCGGAGGAEDIHHIGSRLSTYLVRGRDFRGEEEEGSMGTINSYANPNGLTGDGKGLLTLCQSENDLELSIRDLRVFEKVTQGEGPFCLLPKEWTLQFYSHLLQHRKSIEP